MSARWFHGPSIRRKGPTWVSFLSQLQAGPRKAVIIAIYMAVRDVMLFRQLCYASSCEDLARSWPFFS